MSVSVKLTSRLSLIAKGLDEKLDPVVRRAAEAIESEAKSRVPVGDHAGDHLRDAIHVEKDADAQYRVVAGDSDIYYGHIVEEGSVKMPPHPFLVPALESRRDDTLRAVNAVLDDL